MPEPAPFPMFLGCGRSGTTLVRRMFDAHPQMAIPPEVTFPVRAHARWFDDGRFVAARAVEHLETSKWFPRLHLEPGAFVAAIEDRAPADYPGVLRCLYATYAATRGKPRAGNKTPKHVYSIPDLARLLPEARFIHIVRDGRDVTLSYLDQRFGPSDVPAGARVWRSRVELGRRSGRKLGEARYTEVRYEDVLDDPEREMRRLCAFAGLDFDDAMLRYHEAGRRPELVRDPNHHLAKPPTKGLRNWQSQMSRADVLLFDSLAGETLEAFGYERSGIRPSQAERLRVGARDVWTDVRRRTRLHRRGSKTAEKRAVRA